MNNTIKNILIFAVGVGVGAGTTYVYTKNKFEEIANEEIASVRERVTTIRDDSNIMVINNINEEKKSKLRLVDIHRDIARDYGGDSIPENAYLDPAELEHPQDDEQDFHDSERMTMEANQPTYRKPYIISLEEFAEDEERYDKITLYYYDVDEALTEEDETLIDDPESIVGERNLTAFGDMDDGDTDCIYVRNERLGIDYEIIRLPKSYVEMTLKRGR